MSDWHDWLAIAACMTHETWTTIEDDCPGQMGLGGPCRFVDGLIDASEADR